MSSSNQKQLKNQNQLQLIDTKPKKNRLISDISATIPVEHH